jgi:drug/metabolite transporter (DMT)-like permease
MTPYNASGESDTRRLYSGYVLLVLGVLFWAGNVIVGRAAAGADIPPLALNFWRWAVALTVFLMFYGRQTWRLRSEIKAHWRFILPFCLISSVGYNCSIYIALQKTSALQASLIQSILPVLVLLLGLTFFRTPITGRQWLGVLCSVGGAALVVVRGDWAVIASLNIQEGDAWAMVAVVTWAVQAVIMRWKPQTIPIMPFMTIVAIITVIVMTPLYVWETVTYKPMPFDGMSIISMLYVGICASFLGTTMWNEGNYRTGAARAGYFGNLYPIFAGGLAILILGETLYWYHAIGAGLVFAGICLAIIQRAPQADP